MTVKRKDDIYYVCSLIEFIARQTKNHRGAVASAIGHAGIAHLLAHAEVNHCLPFEQVADEVVTEYGIPTGDFDTVQNCRYTVPGYLDIGRVYQTLVLETMQDDAVQAILDVFTSFLSDEISNFNSSVYYSNPDYLRCSYLEGKLLA
ncbi:MAG: hypothetical protein MR833_02745 [Gemmiger formicilis]|uniref:hypothetical protein n=1 Tax=Gemmiger formicilis TaxID=745368 RepID=UPI003FF0BFDD|nr:hypothetical protein [Gemmiger formicilis]